MGLDGNIFRQDMKFSKAVFVKCSYSDKIIAN